MIKPKKFIEEIKLEEADSAKTNWRLKLDNNENIYGISDLTYSALKNTPREDICFYPYDKKLVDKLSIFI